jgi:hypothetical protein
MPPSPERFTGKSLDARSGVTGTIHEVVNVDDDEGDHDQRSEDQHTCRLHVSERWAKFVARRGL